MYEMDMLKLLTAVALLTVASAAPLMPGEPEAFEEAADGDPGADEINTARAKLLKTGPMTTFPDGDGKTVAMRALDEFITATSSPDVKDETLDTGINNLLKTLTLLSDRHEEIDGSLRTDRTTSSPDSQGQTEKNRLFRLSEVSGANEHDDTPTAAKQSQSDPVTGDLEAREELVKMLSALEELHKLMNRTLRHRITVIPRGNSNGRGTGKKNKMQIVTDGSLKSTTATTIGSGGISPKASTDQMDPKLNGKAFKSLFHQLRKPTKECASGSTALRTELQPDRFHQPLKRQATNPVLKHRCVNSSQWTIHNRTDLSDPCDVCTLDFVHEILLTFDRQRLCCCKLQ